MYFKNQYFSRISLELFDVFFSVDCSYSLKWVEVHSSKIFSAEFLRIIMLYLDYKSMWWHPVKTLPRNRLMDFKFTEQKWRDLAHFEGVL